MYGSDVRSTLDEAGADVDDASGVGDGCAYLLVREMVRVRGPFEIGSISAAEEAVCAGTAVARQRWAEVKSESGLKHADGRAIQLTRKRDMFEFVLYRSWM